MKDKKIYIVAILMGLLSPASLFSQGKTQAISPEDSIYIAYAQEAQRDVVSAVSTIKGSSFSNTPVINVDNALSGRLPGVISMSQPGQPGDEYVNMYIRGLHTSSADKLPLLLVDNIERSFPQLNLNEIEEVTILKDAAATVIYGGRAANGVILVTTKRGKNTGKQELNFNAQASIVQPTRLPKFLNSYDYARLYNEAYLLDGNLTPRYGDDAIEGYRKTVQGDPDANPYLYPNNNYYKEGLKDFSWQQNYDLSMRGGNDFVRYFVLVSYLRQDGLYKYKSENDEYSTNTNYERYNFRSNLDLNISKMVSVGLDMAGRLEYRHQPGTDAANILGQMSQTPANAYPIFNEDGSMGGTPTYLNNIYGLINRTGYKDNQRRIFNATAYATLDLNEYIKGLSFTARGGFDFYDIYQIQRTIPDFKVYELQADGETYAAYGEDGTIQEKNDVNEKLRDFVFQVSGNYKRTINKDHNLSAFANFETTNRDYFYPPEGEGDRRARPGFKTVLFGGRLGYNYQHKYILELSASTYGTENYARNNRFRFYPAAAAGWVLSEESFLKENDIVSFLKIRGSYGKVGLDRVGDRFPYRDRWAEADGYTFGPTLSGQTGAAEETSANYKLHGETSYITNGGLDMSFLQNRLYVTVDVFHEKRKDIFIQRWNDIPGIFGTNIPVENLGQVNSKGVEGGITYAQPVNDKFSFYVGANFMWTKTKVIDLYEEDGKEDYRIQKGHPLNRMMGLICEGFFESEEEIAEWPTQMFGPVKVGDLKYRDLNGDGQIDETDITYIGKSDIPELLFNFDLGFTWKNFEFSALMQYMTQRDVRMPTDIYLPFKDGSGNATKYAFDAWTPETAATARYPRLTTGTNENNSKDSDFWVMSSNFLRIKNVQIAYNLPDTWAKAAGMQRAKIYLNGYNLYSFDGVKDFDAETPFWTAFWQYPNNRTFSMGVNLTF